MDITRRSHLKANGGNGYDYLLTTFIPQLRQSGFSQADVDMMLRDNPQNFSNKDRIMKKIGVAGLQREQIKKPSKPQHRAALKSPFITIWKRR
jgi:DNA-binding transcriptional MerR regulator